MKTTDRYAGVLWGTAVGDALGLPAEGISRRGIERLGWKNNWRHRLLFGRGMLSDDTEHTLLVVEALTAHPNDVDAFQRALAKKLRWWLLALPAGVGMATARAILKLWIGVSPARSGVYSAGNGPAMRSAIIGAYFADQPEQIENYVRAATEITHTDPKALVGALAVAYCAATPDDLTLIWERLESLSAIESEEWPQLVTTLKAAVAAEDTMFEFTQRLGVEQGVSGYTYHTVPVALFAFFRWSSDAQGFERALIEVLNCGGDADTTGAIVGAIAGARLGGAGIPESWRGGICDWPRSSSSIGRCVNALNSGEVAPSVCWFYVLMRNLVFSLIVLTHGLLRLVPYRFRADRSRDC